MSLTSYRAAPPRVKTKSERRMDRIYSLPALRRSISKRGIYVLCRPGGDLLSQVLRHSTIGAEAFDGRVRDGIGSDRYAESHQAGEGRKRSKLDFYRLLDLRAVALAQSE